jgi:two-component system, cell cycle sensor histidine kinase and response regulator CckA
MFWSVPAILAFAAGTVAVAALAMWLLDHMRLSKLRMAHSALAASAASLEHAVQEAIVSVDADGLIRGYNPAAQDLFGYDTEEVQGQNLGRLLLLSEATKEPTRARGPEYYDLPGEARRKDGTLTPVSLRVTPLPFERPPLVRFFVKDRTPQQQHAQLEIENQLLWPTFDEAGLVIALVNSAGEIIRLSGAGVNLLGLSDAEVEGRLYWEVFQKPQDWDSAHAAFDQAKSKLGPSRLQAEWSADGRQVPLDWLMLSPAWNSNGDLTHVVVTAALASHGRLAAQREMHRAVERVAGRIAGHFENLLSTINGYSELVLHNLIHSSPLRKDVEQILAASVRASRITSQLLGFSGRRLLVPERVDLDALLEKPRAQAGTPSIVLGSRRDLEEMLTAIRDFAASRPSERGAAVFSTESALLSESRASLTGDLSPGIYVKLTASLDQIDEAELVQHLLEPFASPSRRTGDVTVGLAVVSGIARSCGGGVSLCRPSNGSVKLEVWLPAAAAENASPEPSGRSARARSAAAS